MWLHSWVAGLSFSDVGRNRLKTVAMEMGSVPMFK